jgi:5'-nucleotidase
MGAICKDLTDLNDLSSCDAEHESFALARALPPGTIDAYFGGHTHQPVTKIVNGIPIVQPPPFGRSLGVIDLWVDPQAHRALPERTQIRPLAWACQQVFRGTEGCDPKAAPAGVTELVPARFAGQVVIRDAALAALQQPYLERVASLRARRLGVTLAGAFTRHYTEESTLGNLMTDAVLQALPGCDFALGNPGGLRANLRPGELTYGDVYEVIPFDNLGATIRLTGAKLRELVRIITAGESVPRVSGLRLVVDLGKDSDKPARERDRVISLVRTDGVALEPDQLYTVATSDFLATGGEGLGPLLQSLPEGSVQILYRRPPLRDLVVEALQKSAQGGPLAPKLDGRIVLQNGKGQREE